MQIGPLEIVAFEIVLQCNLYCDFCVRSASYQLSGTVSPTDFRRRLDRMTRAYPEIRLVALTGGEPFLHPDIVDLARIAGRGGRRVSITTNATIHKQKLLEELASLDAVHLIISLDGPAAEVHDFVRGKEGAFNRLINFTGLCRDSGLTILVNMTVNEKNVATVYDTAKLARELGAKDFSVALVKPEGRGRRAPDEQAILVEVGRQVLLAGRDFGSQGYTIQFTDPLAHIFDVRVAHGSVRRGCGASGAALHVRYNGDILLCTSCSESLGNLDDAFLDVSARRESDKRLSEIVQGEGLGGACGSCTFRDVCGGCRCRACDTCEGFLGPDPLCPKNVGLECTPSVNELLRDAERRLWADRASQPTTLLDWLKTFKEKECFTRMNRNFSGQQRWGHHMTLSEELAIDGEMGWRHREILRRWLEYGVLPFDLGGLRILNIGPWTGGESLLLAALGAEVDAYEESPVYREAIAFLAEQYDLPVVVAGASLYELSLAPPRDYDYVYFSGILSHLSDPLVGLRTVFNHLKDGGYCLLETQTSYSSTGEDEFWGPSRPGWVWLNPSRLTVLELLRGAGFQKTKIVDFEADRRIMLASQRTTWAPLPSRVGLSVPGIR